MSNKQHRNVHGQDGQGIGVFSILIASALAFHFIPPLKEASDTVREQTKAYFMAQFSAAAQQPKKQPDCMMVALSRSPTVGCSFEQK